MPRHTNLGWHEQVDKHVSQLCSAQPLVLRTGQREPSSQTVAGQTGATGSEAAHATWCTGETLPTGAQGGESPTVKEGLPKWTMVPLILQRRNLFCRSMVEPVKNRVLLCSARDPYKNLSQM